MLIKMSNTNQPKAKFSTPLPDGSSLGLTVWRGKKDPTGEVITIQIRREEGESWKTISRLAVYRTHDGQYNLLPERPAQEVLRNDPQ